VFWVISVYFNIRNTLPKSGTFLLGHPLFIYMGLAGHIARMGERRGANSDFVWKPVGKRPFGKSTMGG